MAEFSGANWDHLMRSYQGQHINNDRAKSEIFSYFVKLRKLLEKKNRLPFGTKSILNNILKRTLPLFWLRVQIFPQLGNLIPEFRSTWEKIFIDFSSKMMQALITEYNRLIEETDRELSALFTAHPDISTATKYKEKENELRHFLERLNHRLIVSKDKKFLRNQTTFLMGKASKLVQSSNVNRWNSRRSHQAPLDSGACEIEPQPSLSSLASSVYGQNSASLASTF